MAEIIWSEPALNEIEEIAEFISVSNFLAAQKLLHNVFDITQRLEMFPESGRVPPEIPELGYREVIVGPCRIIYKIESDIVYIVHALRQERDIRRYIILETENG